MAYTYPVPEGGVSAGFWDLRPYSKPKSARTYIHRAWDFVARPKDAAIVAPERGRVFYQILFRCPLSLTHALVWPDTGEPYLFSGFFYDTMGGVVVLQGDSGYIYAFAHLDVDTVFHVMKRRGITYSWVREGAAYNSYVQYMTTIGNPKAVDAGEVLGYIGHSGYSTGYHTHMQIHANRGYHSRIDPAELWPDRRVWANGAGPDYGPREGSDHIPASDLPMDYIRGQ